MADVKSQAVSDLEKLLYKGYITLDVDIDGTKFTLKTLNLQEERNVLEESELTNPPVNAKETLAYIPALLKYGIAKINGNPITPEEIGKLFQTSNAPSLLAKLYEAYGTLGIKRAEAGEEIKNSSPTPTQSFTG